MTTGTDGWAVKAAVIAALPFDNTAIPIEILSESLSKKNVIQNTQGMYGTRSQHSERSRLGQGTVSGTVEFVMSPACLVFLLPKILGANASGTTFALADTMQTFAMQIDRGTKVFNYSGLQVNKATFRGSSGQFVNVSLDLIGVDEAIVSAGGGQALTTPIDAPYQFEDGVMTIAGTGYTMFDFELGIDNKLQSRFGNSLTATRIAPADLREVTLITTTPFGSGEYSLYNLASAGVAVSLALTNGGLSTTFTLPAVQFPAESPTAGGKGEIPLKLSGVARMTSTTAELSVAHDSTA
jgi:hypothetical protein